MYGEKHRLKRIAFLISPLLLLVAACSAAPPTPTPTPIPTPTPVPTATPTPAPKERGGVSLPADEAPHGTPVEWWYFNGHLATKEGKSYGFHYVTFRVIAPNGLPAYILQLSIGGEGQDEKAGGEKSVLAPSTAPAQGFDIWVEDWRMQGNNGQYVLKASQGDFAFDLTLQETKPPALHQGTGLVDFGPGGKSYYYSRTRLKAGGSFSVKGVPSAVLGEGWMDHQWGDISTARVGWDWFSVQLNEGADLMISNLWEAATHKVVSVYGTYSASNGAVTHLKAADIEIRELGSWTSLITQGVYPMGWQIRVAPLGLTLRLEPVRRDSEFTAGKAILMPYWEGEVVVSGERDSKPIAGRGFTELVGYAPATSPRP